MLTGAAVAGAADAGAGPPGLRSMASTCAQQLQLHSVDRMKEQCCTMLG